MKITIINKATINAKPQSWCSSLVDDGQLSKR